MATERCCVKRGGYPYDSKMMRLALRVVERALQRRGMGGMGDAIISTLEYGDEGEGAYGVDGETFNVFEARRKKREGGWAHREEGIVEARREEGGYVFIQHGDAL